MIDLNERLAQITRLEAGGHNPDHTYCAMEAVSYVYGQPWSDRPDCTPRSLAAYTRIINDRAPDAVRQRLIEYIVRLGQSQKTPALEQQRAYLFADYAVRVFAPLGLEHRYPERAALLRGCSQVTDKETSAYAAAVARAAASYAANAATYASYAATYANYAANTDVGTAARAAAYAATYAAYSTANAAANAAAYSAASYAANAANYAASAAANAAYAANAATYAAANAAAVWEKALECLEAALRIGDEAQS